MAKPWQSHAPYGAARAAVSALSTRARRARHASTRAARGALLVLAAFAVGGGTHAPAALPLRYRVRVDERDPRSIAVEIHIAGLRDTLRLGMATHDEYDDRYWRYVRDLRVEASGRALIVVREDSAVWRAAGADGEITVSYRVVLPNADPALPRQSWKPWVGPSGGLVGGIDCFMFVLGRGDASAEVSLDLPPGWGALSGLARDTASGRWLAPNAWSLLDSPFLVGQLQLRRSGRLTVAFLPDRESVPFDTARVIDVVTRVADQATATFGSMPFDCYVFLLMDGASFALEHENSLVLGISSAALAQDPAAYATELAHEFFHTWNLIRLHPAGLRALRTGPTPRVAELWWSEGVTISFADEILLRTGLYPSGQTRATRLAVRIARYLGNPGYAHVSPERASLTAGLPPGANGDFSGDYYLSGQLLGDALELLIRDSTGGARGMDEVIRALYARTTGDPGFTRDDIIRAADSICGCELGPFLTRHVAEAKLLEFDPLLRSVGYRTAVTWATAHDSAGRPLPDTRVYVMRADTAAPGTRLRMGIVRPAGSWAQSGLHSGDELVAVNGAPIADASAFRHLLAELRVGDSVRVDFIRAGRASAALVVIGEYQLPTVTFVDLQSIDARQTARRAAWLAGR